MDTTSTPAAAGPSRNPRRSAGPGPCGRSWILLGALLAGWPAQAHVVSSPTLNNRYLKVSLTGGGSVRVAWTVMYGDAPAAATRRQADLDGNGVLDENEVAKLAQATARAVAERLRAEVDGERRAPVWEPPVPGLGDARVGPIPFSIDVVGRLPAPGRGPHVIKLDDETEIDALGETEIRIEEGPGTRVLQAWRSRDDGSRTLRFLFNGPKYSVLEDRSIGFRFVDETVHRRRRPLPIALLGGLVAAVSALVLLGRARRRARSGGSGPT